jgi:hypothetical protein
MVLAKAKNAKSLRGRRKRFELLSGKALLKESTPPLNIILAHALILNKPPDQNEALREGGGGGGGGDLLAC